MADDLTAALEHARKAHANAVRLEAAGKMEGALVSYAVASGFVPRLLAAVDAALEHHERVPLYGNASTEVEPGACPHDPDSGLHFEADDGSGEWLCEGKPEGAVCSTCVDGEGGERLPWPCDEYAAILAALTGRTVADVLYDLKGESGG